MLTDVTSLVTGRPHGSPTGQKFAKMAMQCLAETATTGTTIDTETGHPGLNNAAESKGDDFPRG